MRVGVHLGDVTEENTDVFGDGVNVAARLENAASPGSVAISDAVFGSLDGTLRPSFDDADRWELKNISRPVQVWVRGEQTNTPAIAGQSSEKLTIVIRPVTISDDRAEVRELADAITGDVSAYLGATMWMSATTALVSAGTNYVLQMGLRSRGDKLRLETQLLGANGSIIRKDKFDGNLNDAFDWQDSVGEKLSGLLLQTVFDAEQARLDQSDIADLTADDCALRAMLAFEKLDPTSMAAALKYASAALEKDPALPSALTAALFAFGVSGAIGFGDVTAPYHNSVEPWLAAAEPLKSRYPALNVQAAAVARLRPGHAVDIRRTLDKVLRGATLNFFTLANCGWNYVFLGVPETASDCLHRALTLGRNTPFRLIILGGLGLACVQAGQYERAIQYARTGLEISTGYLALYRQLAAAHAQLGQMEEARAALDILLEHMPDETVTQVQQRSKYADSPGTRRFLDGLRLAGLPD